ncbi:MAG: hypothetical protein QW350_05830 [Candidatus Aenigmatarchaeota archaeon]
MPSGFLSIPTDNIIYSICYKVINDIVEQFYFNRDFILITYKDFEINLTDARPNFLPIEHSSKINLPTIETKSAIIFNIQEEFNQDEIASTSTTNLNAFPIFRDTRINVYIYPIYVKTDVRIDITFSNISRSKIVSTLNDIRIKLSQYRNILIHDVDYFYFIPEVIEDFIADVFDLRKRLIPPDDLYEYFKTHSTSRMILLSGLTSESEKRLAVYEKQIRVVGNFEFSPVPDKLEKESDINRYKFNVPYSFSIDIPRGIALSYPPTICNRPLPSKYLIHIEEDRLNSKEEEARNINYNLRSLYNLSFFESHRLLENMMEIKLPLNIPFFDFYRPLRGHKGYGILYTFLVEIDENDKRSLFNLRNIEPFYIDDRILNFILNTEINYITKPYRSVFYLGLYQDDIRFDDSILVIDNNLNVKSDRDLDLIPTTRVALSIILDASYITNDMLLRLLSDRYVLEVFLSEFIRAQRYYMTENQNSSLSDDMFRVLLKIIMYLHDIRDFNYLKEVFRILRSDSYIYYKLISIIYTDYYEFLYVDLVNNNVIEHNEDMLKDISIRKNIPIAQANVMTSYIVALKK